MDYAICVSIHPSKKANYTFYYFGKRKYSYNCNNSANPC